MQTIAKRSVWQNASVGEMVAESVKTKSGAERCRKKLSSLHRGASAVCGVYRSVAKGEAENKAHSLRAGEAAPAEAVEKSRKSKAKPEARPAYEEV